MVRAVLSAVMLSLVLSGCVRRFEEARRDEPHAVVKVRVVHHATPGPLLAEGVRWNEYAVAVPGARHAGSHGALRALRVRPEPSRWAFDTTYYHELRRMEYRTDFRTEQYPCGSDTSGYGVRTRYCSRQVPYQRLVTVVDRIVDGACSGAVVHRPIAGAMYVVQYDYFGADRCTVQCLRQVGATDGTFRFLPCGAGEPPADAVFPASAGGEALTPSSVLSSYQ